MVRLLGMMVCIISLFAGCGRDINEEIRLAGIRTQIEFQAKALDGVRVKEARLLDGRLVIVYVRDTHVGPYESATAFPIDLGD